MVLWVMEARCQETLSDVRWESPGTSCGMGCDAAVAVTTMTRREGKKTNRQRMRKAGQRNATNSLGVVEVACCRLKEIEPS